MVMKNLRQVTRPFLLKICIFTTILSMCFSLDETNQSTKQLSIDLRDIGYNETWEKFCNTDEIQEDFPDYPHHDLRRLRIAICFRRKNGTVNDDSLPVFAAYRWCNMIRTHTDHFFHNLIEKFAGNDEEKKEEMLTGEKRVDSECYNKTITVFTNKCMGPQHICLRMFKDLLAHACDMSWLTSETMATHINDVCNGKWISDEIDWDILLLSIRKNKK